MMSMRTLECLVTIVDRGSLTQAAAVLHMSQPALSHQIAAIERELGTPVCARPSASSASRPASSSPASLSNTQRTAR